MAGLRVAVEGCGHGTLHAIYESVAKACKVKGWDHVDLLIIGGDFQAVRNASDLTIMSCPIKYRKIGDFHSYYSGARKAPYLTIFVGGNHEASNHLWELFYGGWVAPNMYYMGAANVLRLGGVRILGMSGIWKGYDYKKPHFERLPYNYDDVRSIYHVREIDVRKLLQIRTEVDVAISHDWPKAIELHGNKKALFKNKPDFEQESKNGSFGNTAAKLVMDRLRPYYWFSAHMHCKYAATKIYSALNSEASTKASDSSLKPRTFQSDTIDKLSTTQNTDEIHLDLDETEEAATTTINSYTSCMSNDKMCGIYDEFSNKLLQPQDSRLNATNKLFASQNIDEIDMDLNSDEAKDEVKDDAITTINTEISCMNNDETTLNYNKTSAIPLSIRAQLPGTFSQPQGSLSPPPEIKNKTVRFLSLDKCLPGRKFLQLLLIPTQSKDNSSKSPKRSKSPISPKSKSSKNPRQRMLALEYDPEWLAITRVFNSDLILGDRNSQTPPNLGEDHYLPMIKKEREWIEENVVRPKKLKIPHNFVITAPPFQAGTPEIIKLSPQEYNNPQTQQFCDLIGIENKFFATEEERSERERMGPPPLGEKSREEEAERATGGRGRGRDRRGKFGGKFSRNRQNPRNKGQR